MRLEHVRPGLGHERGDPNGRLEAATTNLVDYASDVAAERRACFEPVAHGRLITVVDLDIPERWK